MSCFYSRLSYSFGNEDWETERDALRIQPGDRVMCITASGDRPLHLLMDDCSELVSIDTNAIQNHLTHLKKAAMKALDFDRYLSFLGASPCEHRVDSFRVVLPHMNPESAAYWTHHQKSIMQGILYEGALERLLKKISFSFRFFRKKKIDRLFSFDNIEEQRQFVSSEWERPYMRKIFHFCLNHPLILRSILNDPGLYFNLDPTLQVGSYLYDRFNHCLHQNLAKKNVLISLFFNGTVSPEAFPPYLLEEGVNEIKKRLDRLTIKTIDIISYLESVPKNSFDAFSLSDVASYLNQKDFHRLIAAVYKAAKPGASFSIRQFLSSQQIPSEWISSFKRNYGLEEQLQSKDRCFVYRFMVGNIEK